MDLVAAAVAARASVGSDNAQIHAVGQFMTYIQSTAGGRGATRLPTQQGIPGVNYIFGQDYDNIVAD